MTINIELDTVPRFAATVSLDLTSYCMAYTVLQECQHQLEQFKANQSTDQEIHNAEEELKAAKNALYLQHNEYIEVLSNLNGDMHWLKIKELWSTQCDLSNESEQALHLFLSQTVKNTSIPLVLECLDIRFIELLKNSIDAMLINYFQGKSTHTLLKMKIALVLESDMISAIITDNCGGFPEGYLSHFSSIMHSYNSSERTSKNGCEKYCFGGNGLGLFTLASFILQGKLTGSGEEKPLYSIPEGSTVFQISNDTEINGAKITLKTPIAPFPPVSEVAVEEEATTTLTLLPPPARKKKRGGFFDHSIAKPGTESTPGVTLSTGNSEP